MMRLYRPANGTEGALFTERWCDQCEHDRGFREDPNSGDGCDIRLATMLFNVDSDHYPKEWIIASDGPQCTAFESER